jgi:hypothetical protein
MLPLLLLSPPVLQAPPAEAPAARLTVTVRDIPGDPLEGVHVTLEGNQRGLEVDTNSLGLASFGSLPAGRYRIKALKQGYRPASQEVQLEDGAHRKLEFRLIAETRPAPKQP